MTLSDLFEMQEKAALFETLSRELHNLCETIHKDEVKSLLDDNQKLIKSLDPTKTSADGEGGSLAFKEIKRIRLNTPDGLCLFAKGFFPHERFDPKTLEAHLKQFFEFFVNLGGFRSGMFLENFEVVLFENATVLILPDKEHYDWDIVSFNPGLQEEIKTDYQTYCAFIGLKLISLEISKANRKKSKSLQNLVNYFYQVREVGFSKGFDCCGFYSLAD